MDIETLLTFLVLYTLGLDRKAYSAIINSPKNTAGRIGSPTPLRLDCTVQNSPNVFAWYDVTSVGSADAIWISSEPSNIIVNSDRYSLSGIVDNGEANLSLRDLTSDDAGQFRCSDLIASTHAIAQVIALDDRPTCSSNVVEENTVEENTEVSFFCDITYHGSFGPTLSWQESSSGAAIFDGLDDQSTHNAGAASTSRQVYTRTVSSDDDQKVFECMLSFDAPSNLPDDTADTIYNRDAPLYTDSCTTEAITVLYAPKNVEIAPRQSNFNPGSTLTCSGSGNPEPSFQWFNNATGEVLANGTTLTITEDMIGSWTLYCMVTNSINGNTREGMQEVSIIVTIPTTVTSTEATSTAVSTASRNHTGGGNEGPVIKPTEAPSEGLSTAAIGGIIAAGVLVLIIIIVVLVVCVRNGKSKQPPKDKKPPPSDAVRHHPDIVRGQKPPSIYDEEKPPPVYDNAYDNPRGKNAEGLVYADLDLNNETPDLALDNTPRSRNPIQVYEPTPYAQIRHGPYQ